MTRHLVSFIIAPKTKFAELIVGKVL
jgi:hypothetical protein